MRLAWCLMAGALLFATASVRAEALPGPVPHGDGVEEPGEAGEAGHLRSMALNWWSVDGGGGTVNDRTWSLNGTVGQPESGQASHGFTVLDGGLWGTTVDLTRVFDDGFESGHTEAWSSTTKAAEPPVHEAGEQ